MNTEWPSTDWESAKTLAMTRAGEVSARVRWRFGLRSASGGLEQFGPGRSYPKSFETVLNCPKLKAV